MRNKKRIEFVMALKCGKWVTCMWHLWHRVIYNFIGRPSGGATLVQIVQLHAPKWSIWRKRSIEGPAHCEKIKGLHTPKWSIEGPAQPERKSWRCPWADSSFTFQGHNKFQKLSKIWKMYNFLILVKLPHILVQMSQIEKWIPDSWSATPRTPG